MSEPNLVRGQIDCPGSKKWQSYRYLLGVPDPRGPPMVLKLFDVEQCMLNQ